MCRALLVGYVWLACSIVLGSESNTIAPGMDLISVKQIAQKVGREYGAYKHGLAMTAAEDNQSLEFVRIDSATTLVISYLKSTAEVISLQIVIIPERAPKLYRRQVSLNVLSISFDEDGTYTLKLRRAITPDGESKLAR